MNFQEVYALADQNSHSTAFNEAEARLLYDVLQDLPENARIVEIGVEWGRSTAVIGLVGKEKFFEFAAIDSWLGNQGMEQFEHVKEFHRKHGIESHLFRFTSQLAHSYISRRYLPINLLHIDGDHTRSGIITDCSTWLPELVEGGLVCFHDYDRDSLPQVKRTVDEVLGTRYKLVDKAHTFAVFRKLT